MPTLSKFAIQFCHHCWLHRHETLSTQVLDLCLHTCADPVAAATACSLPTVARSRRQPRWAAVAALALTSCPAAAAVPRRLPAARHVKLPIYRAKDGQLQLSFCCVHAYLRRQNEMACGIGEQLGAWLLDEHKAEWVGSVTDGARLALMPQVQQMRQLREKVRAMRAETEAHLGAVTAAAQEAKARRSTADADGPISPRVADHARLQVS